MSEKCNRCIGGVCSGCQMEHAEQLIKEKHEIVTLLHDITQKGFEVTFSDDFSGMLRISYTREFPAPDLTEKPFYEHDHVGVPDGEKGRLYLGVKVSLRDFFERHKGEIGPFDDIDDIF